jgi:hypothetical protein
MATSNQDRPQPQAIGTAANRARNGTTTITARTSTAQRAAVPPASICRSLTAPGGRLHSAAPTRRGSWRWLSSKCPVGRNAAEDVSHSLATMDGFCPIWRAGVVLSVRREPASRIRPALLGGHPRPPNAFRRASKRCGSGTPINGNGERAVPTPSIDRPSGDRVDRQLTSTITAKRRRQSFRWRRHGPEDSQSVGRRRRDRVGRSSATGR